MEDTWDSKTEDFFDSLPRSLANKGYREGMDVGLAQGRQTGYDEAFPAAAHNSFQKHYVHGCIAAIGLFLDGADDAQSASLAPLLKELNAIHNSDILETKEPRRTPNSLQEPSGALGPDAKSTAPAVKRILSLPLDSQLKHVVTQLGLPLDSVMRGTLPTNIDTNSTKPVENNISSAIPTVTLPDFKKSEDRVAAVIPTVSPTDLVSTAAPPSVAPPSSYVEAPPLAWKSTRILSVPASLLGIGLALAILALTLSVRYRRR